MNDGQRRRVAVVGRLAPWNPGPHFANAFRARKWCVTEIDDTACYIQGATSVLERGLARVVAPLSRRMTCRRLIAANEEALFDVILFLKPSFLDSSAAHKLREMGSYLVNWYPDFEFEYAGFAEARLKDFNMVLTTKRHHLDYLRERYPHIYIDRVEHGYCDGVHRPMPGIEPRFDAVYVGNATSYKAALIRAVADLMKHATFGVAGSGWTTQRLPANVVAHTQRTGDEMSAFLASGKVALSFHMGPQGPRGWQDTVSARSFEIPACGRPMIHIDNEDIRSWFEPGREYLPFTDPATLASAIARALADSALRDRLSAAATERAVSAYGYVARGHELAGHIERALDGKRRS